MMERDLLINWIDSQGGPLLVAKKMKLPLETVKHWHYGRGRPSYHSAMKLKKLSGGKLPLEETMKPIHRFTRNR